MSERGEFVECGCVNPIACGDCKGSGIVRMKKDNATDVKIDQVGIVDLASPSTKKGAYL